MSQSHLVLGVPPSSWDESSFKIHCGISEGVIRNIEPVGRYFLAHARRKLNNHSFSEDEHIQAEANAKQLEVIHDEDSEEETPELLSRDPKDWKEQDHYAILGLSKYRWKATDEQIKQAHRKKVLKHHPDKKASSGNTNDDGFFKCIQKAYEILSDPVKRRQFDSVDEAIDDTPPSAKAKGDFFEIYGPVFEREARFSNKTPVPMLGDINTTKSEVEAFYDFWYNFDSWRSFEYLDKEDTDNTDNRDDKRYIERKNKAERARYKKEDTIRLRKIIEDQALSLDLRIQKFKQEEKAAKEAKKKEKEDAIKNAKEAAQRAAEEERLKKEQAEAEAKLKQQEEKKEKANKKKMMRNERKSIKTHVKTHNYFYPPNEPPPIDVIETQLSELDFLFEKLSLEDHQNVRKQLDSIQGRHDAKQILVKEASRLVSSGVLPVDSIKYFKSDSIDVDVTENQAQKTTNIEEHKVTEEMPKERPWNVEEISLLIKAANKFPGGSLNRWERISEYVADHSGLPPRTNEELIKKSKEVQKGTVALDENDVRKLQHQKKHADTRITEHPSMREATIDYDAISASTANGSSTTNNTWSPAQQAQLERALQAYPPSWKGEGDRWDKIAEAVENKTKKECKLRVKYLAEQVKAKKAAQST
ncbi:25047_t:CDS:10 [Dentiscutata erythropus]|uniref:25047_t:CDS:1 n=1 Tax=Dentiscutata erythropus TaxID=1348616 RepID=A0A9N8YVH4_9GLOM|nr:25047_t:CDS:10 [Dentiscutata erythropus]